MIISLLFMALSVFADSVPKSGTSEALPTSIDGPEQIYGGFVNGHFDGCIVGAKPLEISNSTHELVNTKRNHQYGHSELLELVRVLGEHSVQEGWGKITVGDASCPAGGQMAKGHTSHRVGLDVDIFYRFVPPNETMTFDERNAWGDDQQVKYEIVRYSRGAKVVAEPTPAMKENYLKLVQAAAEQPNVERIFVSPPIKKELCKFASTYPEWLKKVRPWNGHRSHFHVRLKCPPGNPLCKNQGGVGAEKSDKTGVGCGGPDFERWFKAANKPKPKPEVKPVFPMPRPKWLDTPGVSTPEVTTPEVSTPVVVDTEPVDPEGPDEVEPEVAPTPHPKPIVAPKPAPYLPEWKRKCMWVRSLPIIKISPDVSCMAVGEVAPVTLRCRNFSTTEVFTRTSMCSWVDIQANIAGCVPAS